MNMQTGQSGPWGNSGSIPARPAGQIQQTPNGQGGYIGQQGRPQMNPQQRANPGQQQAQQAQQANVEMKQVGFRGIPIKSDGKRISQDFMGKKMLLTGNLTDEAFLKVNKFYDVADATVISPDRYVEYGIKPGGYDVKLDLITGETLMVSRKFLVNNFRTPGKKSGLGGKIKLLFVKDNTPFTVVRQCNELSRAIFIPKKYSIDTGNGIIDGGCYLVCRDIGGRPDRQHLAVVSRAMFRCVFGIPMQEGVHRKNSGILGKTQSIFNRAMSQEVKQTAKAVQKPVMQQPVMQQVRQPVNFGGQTGANAGVTKYKYTVINKIMNFKGVCVGYTVKEIANGRTFKVTEQQLKVACSRKLVNNVSLVNNANGKCFLRGNGIDMSKLPKIMQSD